jgi:hypothetical protein
MSPELLLRALCAWLDVSFGAALSLGRSSFPRREQKLAA